MKVKTLIVGQLQTNCYLLYEEKSRQLVIIDPGDDADFIIKIIKDLSLKPQAILATHAHFDHVLAVTELKLAFKIPFYLHPADLVILKRAARTGQYFTGFKAEPVALPDKFLTAGQTVKAGSLLLKVIETPGHTPGSVTFLAKDRYSKKLLFCFSGDLIFKNGSFGRTDLEGGSRQQLKQSIKKILSLPVKTVIYPGHGKATSVGQERKFY